MHETGINMGVRRDRFYISDDHIRRRHGIFIPRQNKYENTEGFPGIRGGRHDCRFRMVLLIPAIDEAEAAGGVGWILRREDLSSVFYFFC